MPLRDRTRAFVGGLPTVFWVLWWGVLINRAASFVVGFLALFLVQERGLDAAAAGRVVALFGVGGTLTSLAGGAMADRVGRRATMLLGLLGNALSVGALSLSHGPLLLSAATLVAGASGQLYAPALNAAVADVVPIRDRPRAFGLLYWGANVGFGLGYAIAATVGSKSLPLLFLFDASTTCAFAALVAAKVPETRPKEPSPSSVFGGLGRVLKDGPFIALLGLHLAALLIFCQWELMFAVDVAAHGVGRSGYAFLLWLNCAGAILLQPLLGGMIQRRDPTRVLSASALLLGLGYGLNAFAHSLPLYAAGVLLWTLGEVLGLPVASALSASLAPRALRGRYQGAYVTTTALAFALSPILSGELAALFGVRVLWGTCFGLGGLVALGHLAAAGPRRRRLSNPERA
jgi:MFS family permease